MSTTQYENIYLDQSRAPGRIRMAESGLGWKASDKAQGGSAKVSEPFLLPSDELVGAYWSRASRGYEMRVQTKNKGVVQFDGFDSEDFNSLKNALKNNFGVTLETREHSLRGWNWGETNLERSELVFNVATRPAFEVPYSAISNTNVVGKSEVSVEFELEPPSELVKAGDELVEMRFFLPGTVSKADGEDKKENGVKKEENGEENGDGAQSGEEEEEQNAAVAFSEALKEKADIGLVAGDAIASFNDILFLTPRGRYDIDMYTSSLRLRGKTYDYKIQYDNIQRLFVLPKPDEIHNILIIQLDPPLRQGQTRYPFLVIQFLKEEEIEVELNVEENEYQEKYADRLKKKYDEAAHQVVAQIFKGLTGKKITFPGSFTSTHDQAGVSCSLKASEGYLYPLEKCFMFVPKPTVYIPHSEISHITFSRVGQSSTSRTFDMTFSLRGGSGQHQFSNIDREEQKGLEDFIKSKGIKIKNDLAEEQNRIAAALGDDSDDDDVEMENVDRGSAEEDSESADEDFEDDDDSDVAEEFDSDAESGSGSEDDEGDDGSDEEESKRAKKKVKK